MIFAKGLSRAMVIENEREQYDVEWEAYWLRLFNLSITSSESAEGIGRT